jgi:hypothetical protein
MRIILEGGPAEGSTWDWEGGAWVLMAPPLEPVTMLQPENQLPPVRTLEPLHRYRVTNETRGPYTVCRYDGQNP